MKIAILTLYSSNYQPLADIVIPNANIYCAKHNYELIACLNPPNFGFHKFQLVKDAFKDYDLIMCMDLDTLITNHNIKVESFIDEEHDFYICQDINEVNAGVFIIKNTTWAKEFTQFVLNQKSYYDCEQNIIEAYKNLPKIKILPHPSINSYPYDEYAPAWGLIPSWNPTWGTYDKPTHEQGNWQEGDFIIHLPGMILERRIKIMKELLHHLGKGCLHNS